MESLVSHRQIPYFDYEKLFSSKENELTTVILKVLRRGAFILQEELRHFEQSISNYLGVRFAVGMANLYGRTHYWASLRWDPTGR